MSSSVVHNIGRDSSLARKEAGVHALFGPRPALVRGFRKTDFAVRR